MSIPQPSLQVISAFDAINGTTSEHTTIIKYNITGGTDLIRSSKLYIYSNTTNELICTHIDNTTYSNQTPYHILPRNTDASIIYASGKSSVDFTNEKYFKANIQGFTQPNGGGDPSGISGFQQFWCLDTPSLSFNAIVSPVDITSYNFTANYNTLVNNPTIPENKIQRYQFFLYDAGTNQIVSTGEQIIGSGSYIAGTQYQLSYNFTGLQDNKTYYAIVNCVTTETMSLHAQSEVFSVEIETPSFTKAKVTNHCLEGYISIESNITNVVGYTNFELDPSTLTGTIDLRGDKSLTWDNGFIFPENNIDGTSQWTLELWGSAFEISNYISNSIDNNSYLIRLTNNGTISIFIAQGYEYGSTTLKTRADLLLTTEDGLEYYTHSNYINNPLSTDNLSVWVRCINGLFEVKLTVL